MGVNLIISYNILNIEVNSYFLRSICIYSKFIANYTQINSNDKSTKAILSTINK